MSKLLLVRHGQTAWNETGRLQGHSDLDLSPVGLRQAAALAGRLKTEKIDSIVSSDLRRARHTAAIIAGGRALEVIQAPDLREIDFGDWEGQTYAQIQENDSQALEDWAADLLHFAPPGGESLASMAGRVAGVLSDLQQLPDDHCRLIVAHGGPLQVLLCLALGLPPERYWQLQLATGSISRVHLYAQGAILDKLNDTHHLEDEPCQPEC